MIGGTNGSPTTRREGLRWRLWSYYYAIGMLLVVQRATAFALPLILAGGRHSLHPVQLGANRRSASCLLRSSALYSNGDDEVAATLTDDDLTKEELASRFVEVLAHYQESKELSPEEVCSSMLRTRLPQLRLNRCGVAPSTVPQAGLGLFATRNVAAEELLTLYPGDALIQWGKGGVGNFGSGNTVGVLFGNHVTDRDASRVTSDEARGYEVKIQDRQSVVADPNLVNDAAYVGHMINDGAALLNDDNTSRTVYSQATSDRHNAAFQIMEGCHLVVVATRDVREGEEIFVSYGEDYWLSRSHGSARSKPGTSSTVSTKKASKKKKTKVKTSAKKGGGGGFG